MEILLNVLNWNGTTSKSTITNDAMILPTLQGIVGGYIEVVPLTSKQVMIVNEEGRLYELPVNRQATDRLRNEHPLTDTILRGNVIIMNRNDLK